MKNKLKEWTNAIQTYKNKKGFTLIELIVVMAIIGILVLLAAPRFLGRTEDALATQLKNDIRVAETKVDEYLIRNEGLSEWGATVDVAHMDGLKDAGNLYGRGGLLESDIEIKTGGYSTVPEEFISDEVRSQLDGVFYTNDDGEVYYDGTEEGVPAGYTVMTDMDFTLTSNTYAPNGEYYLYTGSDEYVVLPNTINGEPLTYTYRMFTNSTVKGVSGNVQSLTNTNGMFMESQATTLDLSSFDTSKVTNMNNMFYKAAATELDLSNFDTSNVMTMAGMFNLSKATTYDLSSFDTSQVTTMRLMFVDLLASEIDLSGFDTSNVMSMDWMFVRSQVEMLDLSNFDTSKVTDTDFMFSESKTTTGYAKTTADANNLNNSSDRPSTLYFTVK